MQKDIGWVEKTDSMHFSALETDSQNFRYEALFNHASMGIVLVDSEGLIKSVNPFALKLFGFSIEELLNKNIEILIPRRYHHRHVMHREGYVHKPNNRPMGVGLDLFGIKKDGTEFPVEVSLGNYQENGSSKVIAFISDITIRKKAEAEIEKLNNDLEGTVQHRTSALEEAMQKLEAALEKEKELGELKTRFVSMASHEFRTPLSTVLSSTYLIEKYTSSEDQPKRQVHINRIISSVQMLTDILNDFLSVGKIEEGKIQVRLFEFNISELINGIINEMNNNIKKGQTIQYVHEGISMVHLDPSLLKHIIMNLISNASKFSPEAAVILIKTFNDQGNLIVSVKDYGIGISKNDQKHLAERFFRGTNAATIQGTGLGLHIISKYADLMNGTIECKSELEKGSEFTVSFKRNGIS